MTRIVFIGDKQLFTDLKGYPEQTDDLVYVQNYPSWLKLNKDQSHIVLLSMQQEVSDGISLLYELKEFLDNDLALVIFVSEPLEDYLQVEAYKNGADEVMILPIGKRLFRHKMNVYKRRLRCCEDLLLDCGRGSLRFNKEKYAVVSSKGEITLSKREFEILSLLDSKAGKVFTRKEIKEEVWGDEQIHYRTIDVYIKKLRGVLGESRIKTMNGVGYKLSK